MVVISTLCGGGPAAAVDCVPDGTVIERNLCATLDAERAERELAAAEEAARARNASDPNALAALEQARAAWLVFRDAALAAAFPCHHDDLSVCFGLTTARCHAAFSARLARERAAQLADLPRPDGARCEDSVQQGPTSR
jgi:uncharacterized protein YecT (DUF1311 family)